MLSDYVMSQVLEREASGGQLRPYDSPFSLVYRLTDVLIVTAALWVSSWYTDLPWSNLMLGAGLIAAVLFYILGISKHLYRSWRTETVLSEARKVAEIWLVVVGVSVVATYAQHDTFSHSLDTLHLWFLITPIPLIGWRVIVRTGLRMARRQGFNTRTLAIAGSGDLARHVAHRVARNPWMGFRVAGLFDDSPQSGSGWDQDGPGSIDALIRKARSGEIDVVYIALPGGLAERQAEAIMRELSDSTASVYLVQDRRSRAPDGEQSSHQVVPNLSKLDVLHRTFVDLGGVKAVSVYESPFLGADGWFKRVEDIIVSSIALSLLAIPMLVIAAGVKLSSPGSVFFKQRRYGLDGKAIMVWKFRSMTVAENGDKVVQASKNDARVTPFGSFLRRTSLDELPQLINVLQGSMSIVGPRPHAIAHNEYYRSLVGGYMLRHKVKPGITGWAQVNGFRGETETVDKMGRRIDYDLDYIRHWSIWLDLRILFLTAFKGFVHKNAY